MRLTDLVPQRRIVLAGLLLAGLTLIAGLLWLDALARATRIEGSLPPEALASLQLDNFPSGPRGSVATWLASVELLLAAATALVIFSVRRHRVDDYHGRYRAWLYVAAAAIAASVDATASLHRLVASQLTEWTGWGPLDGAVWPLLFAGAIGCLLGVRLLGEMVESPFSLFLLTAACLAWTAALLAPLGLLPSAEGPAAMTVPPTCLLGGHLLLWISLLWYARHVVRDADGRLTHRPRQHPAAPTKGPASGSRSRDTRKTGEAASKGSDEVRESPGTPSRAAQEKKGRVAPTAAGKNVPSDRANTSAATRPDKSRIVQWTDGSDGPDRSYDADDDPSRPRKLSKAERKRLRKQKQRRRRAA